MLGIIYAIITVLAWGTWLAPSQNVPIDQRIRTFYTTLGVLLLAIIVALLRGIHLLSLKTFWFPFVGGVIWSLTALSSFIGCNRLGMAKAFGIWAPMNIIVSISWGIILFGEFLKTGALNITLAIVSVLVIIGGILFIIFAGGDSEEAARSRKGMIIGLFGAFGAGIGFASYFVPIRLSAISMWVAALPLAVGMFVGGCVVVLLGRKSLRLEKPKYYFRATSTGILWGIGNYGALRMMELIGTGRGFTIAQLCVVVNALIGILLFKNPHPRSKAAKLTFAGIIIAMIGAIVLGNLKS